MLFYVSVVIHIGNSRPYNRRPVACRNRPYLLRGLFLKVITNSFGGESEASVRDFRSGLPGLRPIVHCPAHDRIDNDVFLRRPGTEETFTEPGPVSRFGILFVEFERIPGTVQVFAAGVPLVRFFVFVDPGIEVFVFYKVQNDCKGTVE